MDNLSNEEVRFVSDASALLSMRDSDFDAYSAFGEVIDNSIQADASEIKILVLTHHEPRQRVGDYEVIDTIAFGDNGYGMDSSILHKCLQLGFSSRYNDRSGIGRFGVGMTLGAINQCKKVEVYSKIKGGQWLYTYIDIDDIVSIPPKMQVIPVPIVQDIPDQYLQLVEGESGTLVIWSSYDRQPISGNSLIDEMDIWIGRTYRKFLWGLVPVNGMKRVVNISINNKKVLAIDPLYVKNERFPGDAISKIADETIIDWPIPIEDRTNPN